VVQAFPTHGPKKSLADGIEIGRARRDLDDIDTGPLGNGVEGASELVVVVPDEVAGTIAKWRGLTELLSDPRVARETGHIVMDDFTRSVLHDEEREDRPKEHVVELKEVARPDLVAVVPDEHSPGLTSCARRPDASHVLLNRAFAHAEPELQELATNPFGTPEEVVLGHCLDEPDHLRQEALRLSSGTGLASPDDLE